MRVVLLLTSLLLCLNSYSQSLLWKISGRGLDKPSYLFGTIHLQNIDVFQLNDSLLPAIAHADELHLELDMTDINPMSILLLSMFPGDSTLKDVYSVEDYNIIKSVFEKNTGQSISLYEKFRPFILMSLYSLSQFQQDELAPVALDQFLAQYAHYKRVVVEGIESVNEQVSITNKMPPSKLLELLVDTSKATHQADSLLLAYGNDDLQMIEQLLMSDNVNDQWENSLLSERNDIHFERTLPGILEGKQLVIAVGVGHLVGDNGLISLFRNYGFLVTPILVDKHPVPDSLWEVLK